MAQESQPLWWSNCCRRDTRDGRTELQVLNLDRPKGAAWPGVLSKSDSFDITFSPREGSIASIKGKKLPGSPDAPPLTSRQQDLRDQLQLPKLSQYPSPPGVGLHESPEARHQRLLEMYQEFVLELHRGTYLVQLTSTRDYSDIHCQLMEDLMTLKLDQNSGRIIEFPLSGVSKVYRIIREDDKIAKKGDGEAAVPQEHIIVVEFMRRKLAFVFFETNGALRFLACMELLIRRARQKEAQRLRGSPRGIAQPVSPVFTASSPGQGREPELPKRNRPLYVCL